MTRASSADSGRSVPTGQRTLFARVLRAHDVIMLGFGAMIGWSWVLLTGYWVEQAGSLGTVLARDPNGWLVLGSSHASTTA